MSKRAFQMWERPRLSISKLLPEEIQATLSIESKEAASAISRFAKKTEQLHYDGAMEFDTQAECILSSKLHINGARTQSIVVLDLECPLFAKGVSLERSLEALLKKLIGEGVTINGRRFKFLTSSPGQLKKGSCYLIEDSAFSEVRKMMNFGIETAGQDISINKALQWRALYLSNATQSRNVLDVPLLMRNVIVVPDTTKKMKGKVLSIGPKYETDEGERNDLSVNLFDGEGLVDSEYYGTHDLQVRGMGIKGMLCSCKVGQYCDHKGYALVVKDRWGTPHKITKSSILIGASMAKNAEYFRSNDEFVAACERLVGDELFVVGISEESAPNKALSRQMLQTLLDARDEELTIIASRGVKRVKKLLSIRGAYEVLSEKGRPEENKTGLGRIVSVCPEIMRTSFVVSLMKERYTSLRDKILSGKVPVNGGYHFVLRDPYAYVDILFGGKDPQDKTLGILRSGECVAKWIKGEKEITLLRSPHAYMEWAKLRNRQTASEWFGGESIYCNVHDLTDRVLQMDFDGDHLLVVDDPLLREIADRTKQKYCIETLFYDAEEAVKQRLPLKMEDTVSPDGKKVMGFTRLIVKAIMDAQRYNKVGQYSNLATVAFGTIGPAKKPEEAKQVLSDCAIIAAGINHAVDACKTGKLSEIPEHIPKRYGGTPYSQRFKEGGGEHKSSDASYWDEVTLPRGDGVVDRLGRIVEPSLPAEYTVPDLARLPEFDYSDLIIKTVLSEDGEVINVNFQPPRRRLPAEMREDVLRLGGVEKIFDKKLRRLVEEDKEIFYTDLFEILVAQRAAFWKDRCSDNSRSGFENTAAKESRENKMREILTDFVVGKSQEEDTRLTKKMKATVMANALLKHFFGRGGASCTTDSDCRKRQLLFDLFGDIYADAVKQNFNIKETSFDVENFLLNESIGDPFSQEAEGESADVEYDEFDYDEFDIEYFADDNDDCFWFG